VDGQELLAGKMPVGKRAARNGRVVEMLSEHTLVGMRRATAHRSPGLLPTPTSLRPRDPLDVSTSNAKMG